MRRLLFFTILLLALVACAPVQQGVQDAVRAIAAGEDGATLTIHDAGVTFDPVEGTALDVSLYVGGNNLVENEDACRPVNRGIGCILGDVSSPVTFGVTGTHLSANVSYYRAETGARPLFFYVRE